MKINGYSIQHIALLKGDDDVILFKNISDIC